MTICLRAKLSDALNANRRDDAVVRLWRTASAARAQVMMSDLICGSGGAQATRFRIYMRDASVCKIRQFMSWPRGVSRRRRRATTPPSWQTRQTYKNSLIMQHTHPTISPTPPSVPRANYRHHNDTSIPRADHAWISRAPYHAQVVN